MNLSLHPATITRRLRSAGIVGTSSTAITPAAVRVSVNGWGHTGVVTAEVAERRARDAANELIRLGYDAARSGASVVVTLPEPTEPTVADLGIKLEGEDASPCTVCALPAEDFPADRFGWTCSDECAELSSSVDFVPVEVSTVGTITVVVTESGPLGRVWESFEGNAFVACPTVSCPECPSIGSTLCDRLGVSLDFPTVHAAVRALVAHDQRGCVYGEDEAEPEFFDGDDSLPEVVSARMLSAEETAALPVSAPRGTAVPSAFRCPACDQTIVVTIGDGEPYSECGGQGEGGCEPWCEGDPAAEQSHRKAVASVVRDALYLRAELPTPAMGEALAEGIEAEARRLGYATTSDYLLAPSRPGSVLDRVETARQRAVVEAVVMPDDAARAHVEAAVVAAATEVDLRGHLVEQLRALAARSLGKVTRLAATAERPSGEGAHTMFLLRAAHVAALADYAAKVVEGARSSDLAATVETATATYLVRFSPGDETPVARAVRFAAGRVELATVQALGGEPSPSDPERLPETV